MGFPVSRPFLRACRVQAATARTDTPARPGASWAYLSEFQGRVAAAGVAAALARFRSTRKTPLPPAARTRSPSTTIQNTREPWLDVAAGGWLPAVVLLFAVRVLEEASVLEGAGVLAAVVVGVEAAVVVGVEATVLERVGCGVEVEGGGPEGGGGLVSGKSTQDWV